MSRGETYLQKYRIAATRLPAEFLREYATYLPTIERCYAEAKYWHGTGRYRHRHATDPRYETSHGHIEDTLESVLQKGALVGHQDLWTRSIGQYSKTVSVAPARMHARLYAHIHLCDGVWLRYVFGGTRFWMGIFIALAAHDLLLGEARGDGRPFVRKALLSRASWENFRMWGSAVRNLDEYAVLPIWRAYDLRSDIAGDHAVLFGIRRNNLRADSALSFLKRFEMRIASEISIEDITHVEVPIENVEETRSALARHNASVPVIPIEFGELYCSRMPFAELVCI